MSRARRPSKGGLIYGSGKAGCLCTEGLQSVVMDRRAESLLPGDLDGRFIFYWIAFGALHGRPKYLQSGPDRTPEESDIEVFLKVVSRLDKENAGLRLVGELHKQVEALVRDKFLSIHCWRQWHKQGVVRGEPPRVSRRPHSLRGWGHGKSKQVRT